MNHQVTPEAIHLCDDSVKLSDRITRLIEQYHSIVPPLCVERARLLTETYRQTESKPHALRRALLHGLRGSQPDHEKRASSNPESREHAAEKPRQNGDQKS